MPKGVQGQAIDDVIVGGPGYIAVGGGSPDGLDLRPIIWVSRHRPRLAVGAAVRSTRARAPSELWRTRQSATSRSATTSFPRVVPNLRRPWSGTRMRASSGSGCRRRRPSRARIMYDVAATPDGVVAVGCHAATSCMSGRTWTSADGMTWELSAEDPMLPYAVAATGSSMVSGGVDSGDYGTGQSVLAVSPDGAAWTTTEPLRRSPVRRRGRHHGRGGIRGYGLVVAARMATSRPAASTHPPTAMPGRSIDLPTCSAASLRPRSHPTPGLPCSRATMPRASPRSSGPMTASSSRRRSSPRSLQVTVRYCRR